MPSVERGQKASARRLAQEGCAAAMMKGIQNMKVPEQVERLVRALQRQVEQNRSAWQTSDPHAIRYEEYHPFQEVEDALILANAWLVLITQDKPLQTPVLDALEQRLEHLTSESHPLLDFRLALSEWLKESRFRVENKTR